jgi:hypothetical protein
MLNALEDDSTLEGDVAEQPQIDIAEPRTDQGVATHVAIGAARANAPGDAGTVGREGSRIEPRRQHTVGGANPAAVGIEHGTNARDSIGAARVGAVKVLIGSRGDRKRPAARQIDNRRDRPSVDHFLDQKVRSVEVVDLPDGGDHRVAAPVSIHRTFFFLEAAADRTQRVVGRSEGIAQIAKVLRGHLSNCRLVRALQRVAPDIETSDADALR